MIDLRKIHDMHSVRPARSVETRLCQLENTLELFEVQDDAPYQRDHVWTEQQQIAFVGHVLMGGLVNPIVANAQGDLEGQSDIVDGKQRLRALLRWLHNEIPADINGQMIYLRKCDPVSFRRLDVRITIWTVQLDEIGVMRLYLRLNRGGTPHTNDEIAKVECMLAELE